jgi:hypothetical protein
MRDFSGLEELHVGCHGRVTEFHRFRNDTNISSEKQGNTSHMIGRFFPIVGFTGGERSLRVSQHLLRPTTGAGCYGLAHRLALA